MSLKAAPRIDNRSPRERPRHARCVATITNADETLTPTNPRCFFAAQIRNVLSNLTSNERINHKRYPWLNATSRGPPFNHYDLGPWNNLMEFWGIGVGGDRGDTSSTGTSSTGSEKDGGNGVGTGNASFRRHPRDYLKVRPRSIDRPAWLVFVFSVPFFFQVLGGVHVLLHVGCILFVVIDTYHEFSVLLPCAVCVFVCWPIGMVFLEPAPTP